MSKLTLLVFVASLLACTYAATKVTDDPIPISAIPFPWYMIPVHPNKQGVSIYGDGTSTALEDQNQGMLAFVVNTVYINTLKPIVDIISSALSVIFGPFTYIGSFVGLSKAPPPEKQRLRRQAGPEPQTETALQTELESDPDSDTDPDLETDPDLKIDLSSTALQAMDIDYLSDLATVSVQFILSTYEYLLAWVDIIIETLNASNDIDFNQLFAVNDINFDEFMDDFTSMVQEISLRISARLWSVIKSDLFPLLDSIVVEFQDSEIFSDDVKQMILSLHAAYQMAHLLDII